MRDDKKYQRNFSLEEIQVVSSGLSTKYIGKKIYYYDEIDSTNDAADQLAREGAREGTIVLTDYQMKGRGRMERKWISPKGKNLLFSIILKPHIDPSFVSLITIMSSVALAKALRKFDLFAKIKWPNDLFVEEKKVAGILTEMKCEQDEIKYLVLGIGVNVNMDVSEFPSSLWNQASSLAMLKGQPLDRKSLFETVLLELEAEYDLVKEGEYERILQEWSKMSLLVGKWVEVLCGSKKLEGIVLGSGSKGELLLKLENGFVESVLSGDVRLMPREG
jgi:BirA family biotin operon repressor/biotin-[acetyl-CoA-carboxylase] ligase